jgi:Protein of unknown function (DUF3313)
VISRGSVLTRIAFAAVLAAGLAVSAGAAAKGKYPDTTDDGLERVQKKSGFDAVYTKPGVSFSGYTKIMIADPTVSFRKNWEPDQNFGRGITNQVGAEDITRIRTTLASEFLRILEEELKKTGGYQIVAAPGDDVLLVQPAIVDLDVNAPDAMSPGMARTYTTSAGEMTLHMDVRDSATNALLARVIDHREDWATGRIQISNSVTNRAAADRIIRSWALIAIKELDAARK